jgi:hypothetical protein
MNNNEKGAFSLIPNYKNNNNNTNTKTINNNINIDKINYLKNESIIEHNNNNNKIHCTCKKTKCIKKYCECFSNGFLCHNCKCENCENKLYLIDNNINNNNIRSNNIINNKSIRKEEELLLGETNNFNKNINNNYYKLNSENDNNNYEINDNNYIKKLIICTCSKSGCNKNYCECFKAKVKCNNKCRCIKCLNKPDDTIKLEEEKMIVKSLSSPINNINNENNIPQNTFTIHRISVNINKVQTLINIEKLDYLDTNKFLNKKRNEC